MVIFISKDRWVFDLRNFIKDYRVSQPVHFHLFRPSSLTSVDRPLSTSRQVDEPLMKCHFRCSLYYNGKVYQLNDIKTCQSLRWEWYKVEKNNCFSQFLIWIIIYIDSIDYSMRFSQIFKNPMIRMNSMVISKILWYSEITDPMEFTLLMIV